MPKTHLDLFKVFGEWGISYSNHEHEPTHRVEESKLLKHHIPGAHTKNLFLYTPKDTYFLVVMMCEERLDIKAFEKQLGEGRLSFASPRRLMERLGIMPGSVSPFCVINDPSHQVTVILDADMMTHEILNYHPLRNDMTVSISNADFRKFFERTGHKPLIMTLPKI